MTKATPAKVQVALETVTRTTMATTEFCQTTLRTTNFPHRHGKHSYVASTTRNHYRQSVSPLCDVLFNEISFKKLFSVVHTLRLNSGWKYGIPFSPFHKYRLSFIYSISFISNVIQPSLIMLLQPVLVFAKEQNLPNF